MSIPGCPPGVPYPDLLDKIHPELVDPRSSSLWHHFPSVDDPMELLSQCQYVRIQGLQNRPEFNGMVGCPKLHLRTSRHRHRKIPYANWTAKRRVPGRCGGARPAPTSEDGEGRCAAKREGTRTQCPSLSSSSSSSSSLAPALKRSRTRRRVAVRQNLAMPPTVVPHGTLAADARWCTEALSAEADHSARGHGRQPKTED